MFLPNRRDYFLGLQLRFTDDDLKTILPFSGGATAASKSRRSLRAHPRRPADDPDEDPNNPRAVYVISIAWRGVTKGITFARALTMRFFPTLVLVAVGSMLGCASESTTPSVPEGDKGTGTGTGTGSNTDICSGPDCSTTDPGSTATGTADDEGTCPPNSQLLYAVTNTVTQVSWNSQSIGPPITLWSYWPPTNEFKKIGDPPCLANDGVANMTVDRNGFAWIAGNSGTLYKVNTTDASCVSSTKTEVVNGLYYPSIAFVGTTVKTLYVYGATNESGRSPTLSSRSSTRRARPSKTSERRQSAVTAHGAR